MIVLTAELIQELRTPAGGFNQATMDAVGIGWPLREGWPQRAVGLPVSDRKWKAAMQAKTTKLHRYRGNTRRH